MIVETAHRLGGLTSQHRVTPAVEEILVETGTVLTRVEVALTHRITKRVTKPPYPPLEQRKTSSDMPHLVTDKVNTHAAIPDETRLEIQLVGIGPVAHTGLRLPIPTPIGKKVLAVPQKIGRAHV